MTGGEEMDQETENMRRASMLREQMENINGHGK
jgi:hypothetical protein